MADIEFSDIMNMLAQGGTLAAGLGGKPTPAAPAFSAELGTEAATQLGAATAPGVAPKPGFGETLLKSLQQYSVPLMGMGGAMMGGKETVGGQVAGILGQTAQTMQMNEALRKLLGPLLAGGGQGFQGSQMPALGGAEVAGLTPEMVSGLYGTALKVREAEREAPLKAIAAYGTLYQQVMTGDYHAAQVPMLLAQAEKYKAEAEALPATTYFELVTKMQKVLESQATVDKLRAETQVKLGEPAKLEAETKEIKAKTAKTLAEIDPEFIAMKKYLETKHGELDEIRRGNVVTLVNRATGKKVAEFEIGAEPKAPAEAAAPEMKVRKDSAMKAAAVLLPGLEAELAKVPGGKQRIELQQLLESMRGVLSGEIDPEAFRARAAKFPDLAKRFESVSDIYRAGLLANLPEATIGELVRAHIGKPAAAPAAPAPGEKPKSVLEKYTPPAAKQGELPGDFYFASSLRGKQPGWHKVGGKYAVFWDGKSVAQKMTMEDFEKTVRPTLPKPTGKPK